jgi:acetyltransferase-like isoleucine patch superfamily enzyme
MTGNSHKRNPEVKQCTRASLVLRTIRTFVAIPKNRRLIIGKGNTILARGAILNNVFFDIRGDHNSIVIKPGAILNGVRFHIRGSSHLVFIGSNCQFRNGGVIWFEDSDCHLTIDDGTWIEEANIALTELGSSIEIGKDCLIAYDVDIRCGDSHSIIDLSTGKRINKPSKGITIGDHVWLATHVNVLKGVTIGPNSVVGIGSVVTRDIPPNSMAAGVPAEVIRGNITWDRDRSAGETSLKS